MGTEKNNLIALYGGLTVDELSEIKAKDLAQSRNEKQSEESLDAIKFAPLTSRLAAKLIDVLLLSFVNLLLDIMFGTTKNSGFLYLLFFLALVLGDSFFKGQSIGKRIMSITVIDINDNSYCSRWQSFLRNITLIFWVIDIPFIFGKNKQRLGDIAAKTIVVNNKFLSKRSPYAIRQE